MKKIFKKNQIIITALAIMILVAGYLNFSQRNISDKNIEVGEGQVLDYDTQEKTASDDINDSFFVDFLKEGKDVEDVVVGSGETNDESGDDFADISDEDRAHQVSDTGEIAVDNNDNEESTSTQGTSEKSDKSSPPGEAVLVSTTAAPDYFINAKVSREQLRAKNKDVLMGILENSSVSEADKSKATQEIINLTSISEKENSTETLLEGKGYSDAVVSIDENVSVVINATSLNEQDIAQIEDIIKRETGADITEIVIYPVVVTD